MRKANMMIIRGRHGRRPPAVFGAWSPLPDHVSYQAEFVSESWTRLQHHAYKNMAPLRMEVGDSYFELVLLVPGEEPVRAEVFFPRGCNGLALPGNMVELVPFEFFDPIQAMDYAVKHGLETPPYVDLENWRSW